MQMLPAIDLIDGKCVRLIQGKYDQQITYKDNPVEQAEEFKAAGADWLHIVDLDGAKAGKCVNVAAIKAIIDSGVELKIEVGGGIRDEDSICKLLEIGVTRLILGTVAVNKFDWFCQMAEKYPDKLVLGLDGRGENVSVSGWLEEGEISIIELAKRAANLPLNAIIYTDIMKDGMLCGPNFERTKALIDAVGIPVIAAGGVTKIEDITKLAEIGAGGAIMGRALYEGDLDLAEAIKAEAAASKS
jgi:phosphoribosylformimino-5-aminoimidazole carboxamide ribotide isomerase